VQPAGEVIERSPVEEYQRGPAAPRCETRRKTPRQGLARLGEMHQTSAPLMSPKERTVISADPAQILRVREIVQSGRYATVSEFVRTAIEEKLGRDRRLSLEREVERYVAAGHVREDADMVRAQAWKNRKPRAKR
jgi:Arc/MetJ-type ribon-helix-helix transcriptional regulator